jgi:transcriptional regulator with XRE-family HTH domain
MSIADYNVSGTLGPEGLNLPAAGDGKPLHRLGTVRRLQGVSRRAVARRLNVDVSIVKQQEDETSDLPLSMLYKWQQMLEVPIAELLVDEEDPLSPPIMKRARMVRLMKTVLSILERSNQPPIRRMAQNLVNQLVELMPELKGVTAWHAVGQRRRLTEYGRAAERRISSDVFLDLND